MGPSPSVRRRFSRDRFSRFPGTEPLGDYPLHIIVKRGVITLLGVVDSEADKTVAGFRARDVTGSLGVENELVVEGTPGR
jgi:osmotically-inducible protein OsmY